MSNAIGDEPSTFPGSGVEARRSRTGFDSLLEFKRASISSFDPHGSKSNDTQNLSCAKQIIITELADLGALRSIVLKSVQQRLTEVSKVPLGCWVFQAILEGRPRRLENIRGLGLLGSCAWAVRTIFGEVDHASEALKFSRVAADKFILAQDYSSSGYLSLRFWYQEEKGR